MRMQYESLARGDVAAVECRRAVPELRRRFRRPYTARNLLDLVLV